MMARPGEAVPRYLRRIEKVFWCAVVLELLVWLCHYGSFIWFVAGRIGNQQPGPEKTMLLYELVLYIALVIVALLSRVSPFCWPLLAVIAFLTLEIAGAAAFVLLCETIWTRSDVLSVCLVSTSFLSVLRYTLDLLGSNHYLSIWMYPKSSIDVVTPLRSLENRRKEMQTSYDARNTCSEKLIDEDEYLATENQSQGDDSAHEEPISEHAHQDNLHQLSGPSSFVQCFCASKRIPLVARKRPTDPELGHVFDSVRWTQWIERRTRALGAPLVRSGRRYTTLSDQVRIAEQHHLCHLCQYFSHKLSAEWGSWGLHGHQIIYEHVANVGDLKRSARNGCHLCTLIWSLLNRKEQEELLTADMLLAAETERQLQLSVNQLHQKRISRDGHRQRCIRLAADGECIVPHYGRGRIPRRWLKAGYDLTNRSRWNGLYMDGLLAPLTLTRPESRDEQVTLELVSENTGDDFTMSLVSNVLRSKKLPWETSWTPNRLLDIGSLQRTGKVILRDKERFLATAAQVSYVALSHCWGTKNFLTYNDETRADFENGMPVSLLTQTFQDAINVAHRLGFDFIWIDSLCLLQGTAEDWEIEAPMMCKVYSSASVTIVAAAAVDGSGGLFKTFSPLSSARCLLRTDDGFHLYVGPSRISNQYQPEDISLSKWASRGWTLQEQLLSKRLVYFGQRGVYFQVRDGDSHTSPGSIRSQYDLPDEDDIAEAEKGNFWPKSWHIQWWSWVIEFTNRKLSNAGDRGMAMLGLAQHLSTTVKTIRLSLTYAAGLWKETLITDLLWYVEMEPAGQKSETFRAPSWSWISIEGSVNNDSLNMSESRAQIEILQVHGADTERHPQQTLPQGSYLQLRGKLRTCVWSADSETMPRYYVSRMRLKAERQRMGWDWAVMQSVPIASTQQAGPRCYPMFHPEGGQDPIGWFVPDTTDLTTVPDDLHCLCIDVQPKDDGQKQDLFYECAIRGLVLEPLSHRVRNEPGAPDARDIHTTDFRRLGYFGLESAGKGVCFPSAYFFRSHTHDRTRRVPPVTDPLRMFTDCPFQTIRIF